MAETVTLRPLPALWDGVPVEWDGFERDQSNVCPRPLCCAACGSDRPAVTNVGRMEPKGLLVAVRCLDCATDVVRVGKTGESWTLDESDYGPLGSTA